MKKFFALVLALCLTLTLAACQKAPAGEQTKEPVDTAEPGKPENSPAADETYKVGLSFPVMDAGQTALSGLMKDTLLAADPNMEVFITSADGNNEKQLADVEDLITKGCDLIYLMAADADAMAPAVDAIHDAGILCGIARDVNSENYDFKYVSAPSELPGELQGEWLVEYAKAHPDETFNIAHVSGTATNSGAVARRDGFYNTIMAAGLSNINWVVEQDCNYITETAQACVEGWLLSHPEVNVLCCANDDMAMGASNAVQAAGRSDIMILGIDGQDTGISMLSEGSMSMTVRMNVEYVGSGAADAILGMLNGTAKVTEDKVIYGDMDKIYTSLDESNVAEYKK